MKWLLSLVFFFGSLGAMSRAPVEPALAENIGVHTANYQDAKRNRPVVVEIWYPTVEKGPIDQPEDPGWVHPEEIRDVSIAEGRHPMIVMSHGHGGDRRDRSWIAPFLVKKGYIVASVEHYGNSWRNYNPLLTLRFWERARDVSFAITELLKDSAFKKKIDSNRIGFVGYSLGGMTGLALGGAKAKNVKEIVMQYVKLYKDVDPELVDTIDFSEASSSFTDRRIKALALLSPATFIFPPQSFKKIKVPVALVASEGDEVLPHEEHALKLIKHLGPAKLKLFRDKVSHYVFLNRVSDIGKDFVRQDIQTEEIQTDRLKIHKEIGKFIADFFEEHLR